MRGLATESGRRLYKSLDIGHTRVKNVMTSQQNMKVPESQFCENNAFIPLTNSILVFTNGSKLNEVVGGEMFSETLSITIRIS